MYFLFLLVAAKASARDSSPTSGTDRDSPDLVLKSDPDAKDDDDNKTNSPPWDDPLDLYLHIQIGRASCREKCLRLCRSRWSPYH